LLLLFAASAHASKRNLLVVGDSLSAAYGIAPEHGWVRLLQQRLDEQGKDYRVINASITGDTTHGGLTRLAHALQRHKPALVIIELGGNDGLRGFDLDSTHDNLQQMIRQARAQGAKVLLLGVRLPANYGKIYGERFSALFTRLADTEQVTLVPAFMLGVADHLELMQADGIHPGVQAQPKLLDNVWPALAPLL
jgi:acyl-CoA thioesterase-1